MYITCNIETYHLVFIISRLGIILYNRNVFLSVRKTVDCGKKFTQNEN